MGRAHGTWHIPHLFSGVLQILRLSSATHFRKISEMCSSRLAFVILSQMAEFRFHFSLSYCLVFFHFLYFGSFLYNSTCSSSPVPFVLVLSGSISFHDLGQSSEGDNRELCCTFSLVFYIPLCHSEKRKRFIWREIFESEESSSPKLDWLCGTTFCRWLARRQRPQPLI